MIHYEGALIQMVELPALIEGSSKGKSNGREIISLIRNADAIIIVGKSDDQKIIVKELEDSKIYLNKTKPPIKVKVSSFRGIQISGKEYLNFPKDQLIGYLKSSSYANSNVIVSGPIKSLGEVSEALDNSIVYKPTMFLNTRTVTDHSLIDLRDQIFLLIGKILVYTKKPGKEVELKEPMSLPKGSTLFDLATHLHKDFAKKLKNAKVWGSTKFPGQRVGPEYELHNKDVVEINI